MVAIPAQVLGSVANMAVSLARAKFSDAENQSRMAGVAVMAAVAAIESCSERHGVSSAVWKEVTDTLGSPDAAVAFIERLASQQQIKASTDAEPFLRQFTEAFLSGAISESPNARLETTAILTAIALLKLQLPLVRQPMDPLSAIPWHRKPGAPIFRVSPAMDGQRFSADVELIAGAEPGDVVLSWAVDEGPEVAPQLMPYPSSRWRRTAKPASCDWPGAVKEHVAHLRLRFVTADGEHGWHYWFPLVRHEKGHWILQTEKGTTVFEPEPL